MAEPKIRFKKDDGSNYPKWEKTFFRDLFQKNNERNCDMFSAERTISIASMTFNPNGNGANEGSLSNYKVLRIGDVAFEGHENKEYSHGRFVLNDIGNGIMSPRFSCIRPIIPMVYKFWKYYIHSETVMKDILIRATKKGTMMHELVFDDFFKQCIPVPCLEEQQKIADFLSSLDEIISASEEEIDNLETQKKAVMKKIFSQEVRFKRLDGSDFSKWEEATLNDISERIIVGLATTVTPYYCECGVPMFRNLNIKAGYLDDSNILYLDKEYASKQRGKYIHAGDILTVHTGNIGWSCVVPDCYEGALSFTTLITTLKNDNITNEYVCTYLNSDLGMKQMQDLAFSGGRANLNTSEFQKVIIPIPCLEEQLLIADFLSDFDEAIAAAKKELELWKELKKGLLQQMFV